MSRWFRFYTSALDDPKVQMLSPDLFKHWVNVLCIAAAHDGELPSLSVVAFSLGRMAEAKAASILAKLCAAGLLDKSGNGFRPHNWDARQYRQDKSDPTNADRQQRYREKKRNAESNGVTSVTEKRPDSTEYREGSEASASGAVAPVDHRKRLFSEGLPKVQAMTGKGPDASRSFVGKCLKLAGDDAMIVLGLIEDAERNQVVDPCAWILARLEGRTTNGKSGSKIIQAADDLRRKIAGFDGPPRGADELRSGAGEAPVRLLSNG